MRRLRIFQNRAATSRSWILFQNDYSSAAAVLSSSPTKNWTPEEDLRNDSGDFEFWQRWDDFLNLFFLDIWTYGGHSLKSLVVRIGGAPLAGREDWDPNLDHAHWLAHGRCRRYREKVLLLLRDGIR